MRTVKIQHLDTGAEAEVSVDIARHLIQQRRAVEVKVRPAVPRPKQQKKTQADADSAAADA